MSSNYANKIASYIEGKVMDGMTSPSLMPVGEVALLLYFFNNKNLLKYRECCALMLNYILNLSERNIFSHIYETCQFGCYILEGFPILAETEFLKTLKDRAYRELLQSSELLNSDSWDALGGMSGMLYLAHLRNEVPKSDIKVLTSKLLDYIHEAGGIPLKTLKSKLQNPAWLALKTPAITDLGLAHGSAGILAVLSDLNVFLERENWVDARRCREILYTGYASFRDLLYDGCRLTPKNIVESTEENGPGWCYGSLGLYFSVKRIERNIGCSTSLCKDLLLHVQKALDQSKGEQFDISLCHGYACLILTSKMLANSPNDIESSISAQARAIGIKGTKLALGNLQEFNTDFLNGLSGLGLALLNQPNKITSRVATAMLLE